MQKLLFAAIITFSLVAATGCVNKTGETVQQQRDSIINADSMAAVNATDSIAAFNDSISRADSLQNNAGNNTSAQTTVN